MSDLMILGCLVAVGRLAGFMVWLVVDRGRWGGAWLTGCWWGGESWGFPGLRRLGSVDGLEDAAPRDQVHPPPIPSVDITPTVSDETPVTYGMEDLRHRIAVREDEMTIKRVVDHLDLATAFVKGNRRRRRPVDRLVRSIFSQSHKGTEKS